MHLAADTSGIVVAEGNFSIRYRNREGSYPCRVTFDLTRDHHFVIECLESVHELRIDPMPKEAFFVTVSPSVEPIECLIVDIRSRIVGEDQCSHLTLSPRGGKSTVCYGSRICRLYAGIPNFFQYWFGGPRKLDFRLKGGDWVFEFTPVGDETLLYPSQIQNDRYSFTHYLEVQKNEGEQFSCAEAMQAIDTLSIFLRFCSEHWICPVLIVGLDESGKVAMEDWGTGKVDPRCDPTNWLDRDHGNVMAEVLPGFWRLLEDPLWRDAVRTAVYWYVRADTNHVGPDGAIILIQAALERLAWHVLVQQRHAVSELGFTRKLQTADRIRLLLDACSIPLEFPPELADLHNSAPAQADGSEAFVSVRNRLVHPRERQKPMVGRAYYEALQLGKWYLELVLLHSCGFNGQYSRRLKIPRWVGEVEVVPWAR